MNKSGRGAVAEKIADLPKRFRVFFFLFVFVFIFGTIIFALIENLSFSQGFFRTLEALAFMFHSETLHGKLLEIFLGIFGVFAVWWILWSIADMFIEGKISEYLKTKMYNLKLKKMGNHYVIVGGGRVGEEIAKILYKNKKDFVVVEKNPVSADKLRKKGYLVIDGDIAESEIETLEKTNIKNAAAAILVMPETDDNLMAILAIKEIAPDLDIYSRAENSSYVNKLKKAGAKEVIVPEVTAAEKFLQNIEQN
ncbi:MAG: NAD(P)-binding protein [Candidatus Pacearchaeota archaeon]